MFGEVAQLCNPLWKREITIAARDETMKVKYDIDNKWEIIVEIFKFINSSSFDIIISENVKTEANQWLVQEFLFMIMSWIPKCYKKMDLFLKLGNGYEEIKLKSEKPIPRIKDMINSESVWRLCCRKSVLQAKSVFTANSIIPPLISIPDILSPDKSNCEENNNNRPSELHTLQTRNNLKGILNRVAWQCKPLLKRRVSIAARGEILIVALVGKKEATNCVKKILKFINLSPFDIIFSEIYNSEINHWSVAKFLNKFQVEMSKYYYGWEAFLKLEKRTEVKLEWFSRTCFTKIEDVINSELNWKLCIRPQTNKTTLDLQAPYVQNHPDVINENLTSNLNLCIGQQPSWSPPNIPTQCEVNVLMQSPIFKESMNQISAIQPSLLNQPTTSYHESTLLFENKSSSDAHFESTTIFENKASADCCRESNSIFDNKTFLDSHYELSTKCESKANPNPRFESIPIFENKASPDSHFKSTTMFEIKASTNFHIESTTIFENEARPDLHFNSSLIFENRASPDFHIESTTSFEKNASFDSHFESTPVFENKESTNSHSESTSVFENKESTNFHSESTSVFENIESPDSHFQSAATFESKVGSKKNTEMHETFHKVFFVGRSDLIDTLKDCNNNSSLICYTFDTYSEYEISNLLKQLYFISGNSVCCLVFDISVISKPLISTECFKRGCKEPLYPSALKIKNLNSSPAIFKELKDIISEQLQLVKKFIEKLSVHLPVIILPLAPMRIYCHDESSMQNHQISHSMSGLRTCVASGPRHLWKQAIAILVKSWYNLMELTNRKYDPLQCLFHCKSANQTVFPFVEGVGDILSTWSEPDNWKSLINSYTSSLIPAATQIDPYMASHENLNASYTRKRPKSRSSSPNKRFCSQSLKQHKSLSIEFVGHEETSSVINDMKKFTSKLITDFDSRGTSDHTSSCRIGKSDLDSLRRSRSRPSPRLRSFSRAKESVSFLAETCNDKNLHSSEPELRVRFGPALFSEYSSKLEEIKLSFKEEFLIFKSVPELHPNFEKYYEIFAARYHRKHRIWDADHKDREWKIFWKSNFNTIKARDWQIKHENFKKEFEEKSKMISPEKDEKRILHIHSTVWNEVMKDEPFVFDKAVYLVASLCDNAPYLGPAVASVIETNRNLGTVTKEAYKVFTESENVSLLNLLSKKFESLIQTTTDAITCYMYRKAVEWIPKLLEESETCCKINANEPEDESTLININAVAKLSSGKRPAEIKQTIKWALTYEGISDPSAKLIDDLFLKVNSLH